MVYTCGKCKAKMHDDPPHFTMFHKSPYDDESSDCSAIVIECPVCGAICIDILDGSTPWKANGWYTNSPLRSLWHQIKNFLKG